MKNKGLTVIFLGIFLLPVSSQAFVPSGSHIIKLAADHMVKPAGIAVLQEKQIYTPPCKEEPFYTVTETAVYSYPGRFSSRGQSHSHETATVISKDRFIRVTDGYISSQKRLPADFYTDILLYRNRPGLQERLETVGVDIEKSSIERHEGNIYFVVGDPPEKGFPSSSLWIDKESLLPGRYTVKKTGRLVDIRYLNWQKVSRTWYPRRIEIYFDKDPLLTIRAEKIELKSDFNESMFDIEKLRKRYPQFESMDRVSEPGGGTPKEGSVD